MKYFLPGGFLPKLIFPKSVSNKKLYGFNNIYDVARDLLPDKIRRLENEDALINNINILGSNFKGIAKDYILGKQMFEFLKTNSIISDKAYRYYKKKSVDNEYNLIIKYIRDASKVFSKKSKKYKYDRLIVANNLKVTTIEEIIKKGKGKIILLDFWASWCQPCLEQMEYWNKLKKDYRDKEIEFISISIDTDLNSWLRKNELLGFDLEKSFITENKLNQKFIKFHDISFIPRLILIDKNGNIIDDNTPEPSDNALKVLIDKNL